MHRPLLLLFALLLPLAASWVSRADCDCVDETSASASASASHDGEQSPEEDDVDGVPPQLAFSAHEFRTHAWAQLLPMRPQAPVMEVHVPPPNRTNA